MRLVDRIRGLEGELSKIELERQAMLEALSANRAVLRFQASRIRETFRRLLHEDTTLAERIRTLFREKWITIASILTRSAGRSRRLCLRSLVVRRARRRRLPRHLTGVDQKASPGPRTRPGQLGRQGCCGPVWYQRLDRLLAPEYTGSTAAWLSENLWAAANVVGLFLVTAQDWLRPNGPSSSRPHSKPKRH